MSFRINKPSKNRRSYVVPYMEVEIPPQISPFERPVKPPEEQISYGMFDPRHRFGVHLSKGEKPKFRFMFYLSHYGEKHAEDLLTWWTFVDIL